MVSGGLRGTDVTDRRHKTSDTWKVWGASVCFRRYIEIIDTDDTVVIIISVAFASS